MNYSCNYKPDPIPRLENLYTYKDANKFIPKVYKSYADIYGGEIEYLPIKRTAMDNFKNPNFKNNSYIESKKYVDPMGAFKPEYTRKLTKNNYEGQLSWIQDTCEHREEMISLISRPYNRITYEPAWKLY